MRRIGSLLLVLALALPTLTACTLPGQAATDPFDALARWVARDADTAFFLDFHPGGDQGRHWESFRRHLEANPVGPEALHSLLSQFRVEAYGLGELITGPVVGWQGYSTEHIVAQVSDGGAVGDDLLQHFENVTWEQEQYEGTTIYHGKNPDSWQGREWVAWTVRDGLLFVSLTYAYVYHEDVLTQLRTVLDLDYDDSLAALPSWRSLRERLPQTPMGLLFFNAAAQAQRQPPDPHDASLGTALSRHLVALALAAVPEEQGMRVEIVGEVDLQDAPPELVTLFDLPAAYPAGWDHVPADAAFTFFGSDASVVWPWLREMFNLDALDQLRDAVGLDMGADLAGVDGPLTGEFALAITPPLPGQPISQGLTAGQLLIVARGASQEEVTGVQAAMEGRGATFGPREAEGVALQTQVGTELSGYAISLGFDGETFLLGSSPQVIGHAVVARRGREGLVATEAFRAVRAALPDAPSVAFYINREPLVSLNRANTTGEQSQSSESVLLEVFEGIGLGLRLPPDGQVEGVAYFFVGRDQ